MAHLFTRCGTLHTGPVRVDAKGAATFLRPRKCSRCGGAGRSDKWAHTGYTCFDCGGNGQSIRGDEAVKLYTAEKLAKLNAAKAKADAKRAAKAAEIAAARAAEAAAKAGAFRAEHGALLARAEAHMDNEFIADVITRAIDRSEITEAQAAAVSTAIDRIESRRALARASRHVGRVGDRLETIVTVERVTSFGRPAFNASWITETVYVVTMRDAEGNCIVSMSPRFHVEQGARFTLRATIKDHSNYQGQQQTKVTRAKVITNKQKEAA